MDANSENLGLKIDNLLSKFDQSQINLVNSIEEKINNLREEFQSTSSDVKRIKLDREFKWKREGNRDQFNFATQISEILNQSVWAIKNKKYDYALENLEEALKNLKSRIKHIKLADSSDAGWDIIKNYVQNDLASDSDDDRKIIRAVNTALRKAKRKKASGGTKYVPPSGKPSGVPVPAPVLQVPHIGPTSVPLYHPFPRGQFAKQNSGACHGCGSYTHWRRDCPYVTARTPNNPAASATTTKQT